MQRIAALLLFFVALLPARAPARLIDPATNAATRPSQPRYVAQVITFSPGSMVWERFGHNGLFVFDSRLDETWFIDFGNFAFDEPGFLWRFVFGEMRYWAESKDTAGMISVYSEDNRQIWSQQLLLSDEQIAALLADLRGNLPEDKKFYRYDYYRDNCSTRVRDAIDRATGGELGRQLRAIDTPRTFRQHTRIAMDQDRWLLAGVEFATARMVDRPLTAWEECFLPERLMAHLPAVRIARGDGTISPLVGPAREVNQYVDLNRLVTLPARPGGQLPWFLLTGVALGSLMGLSGFAARRAGLGRVAAAVVWGAWGLIAGAGGSLLAFLWGFTLHESTYRNENLLQVSPVLLAIAVLGPMVAFGKGLRAGRAVAIGILALSLSGIALKALPWFWQDNWNVIALSLPAHAGLLAGFLYVAASRTTRVIEDKR